MVSGVPVLDDPLSHSPSSDGSKMCGETSSLAASFVFVESQQIARHNTVVHMPIGEYPLLHGEEKIALLTKILSPRDN